jgi:hypothetical protein
MSQAFFVHAAFAQAKRRLGQAIEVPAKAWPAMGTPNAIECQFLINLEM